MYENVLGFRTRNIRAKVSKASSSKAHPIRSSGEGILSRSDLPFWIRRTRAVRAGQRLRFDGDRLKVRSAQAQAGAARAFGSAGGADVLVLTRDEFDETSAVVYSLPATVLREGKTLYAAA